MKLAKIVGPALIVAAVVLGPGSILSNTKVGAQHGYSMVWLLLTAAALMVAMVALAARLGVLLPRTPCEELAHRLGRPVAITIGLLTFVIITGFQATNNLGVLAACRPLLEEAEVGLGGPIGQTIVVSVLNGLTIGALFGAKRLYGKLERLMTVLVGVMIVGFVANLIFAKPQLSAVVGGLVPGVPERVDSFLPVEREGQLHDPALSLQALVATTFSVAGAFYQAYLVREKGWGRGDLNVGLVDSIAGIAVLALISMTIMVTSAAVFHGTDVSLRSAADVARQLEPLFGTWAKLLFGLGLFAGAFSSFLVNALIGGTLLADGLGLGGRMDGVWTRRLTVAVLATSAGTALAFAWTGASIVDQIVYLHALTVLAVPALAAAMLWLATRADVRPSVPGWMLGAGVLGFILTLALAVRTGIRVAWALL